jgi:hypothetical protein
VTLPDIGYGATQVDALEGAPRQAEDLLEETVLGMMANDEEVPSPSRARGRPSVGLPALTAAKLELYRTMSRGANPLFSKGVGASGPWI